MERQAVEDGRMRARTEKKQPFLERSERERALGRERESCCYCARERGRAGARGRKEGENKAIEEVR